MARSTVLEFGVWLLLIVGGLILTCQFDGQLSNYKYGAAGWPRVVLVFMFILAMAQVLKGSRTVDYNMTSRISYSSFLIPLLYLFFMPRMGFYISTPLFLGGYMGFLGESRLLHIMSSVFLAYFFVMLIFLKLLFVPLPVGSWGGFYEINSYLVAWIK